MQYFKSIKIKIKNPSWRQRFVIITANFLIWTIIRVFKNDEKKMKDEIKDIIKLALDTL
jgi:hypothetical protein